MMPFSKPCLTILRYAAINNLLMWIRWCKHTVRPRPVAFDGKGSFHTVRQLQVSNAKLWTKPASRIDNSTRYQECLSHLESLVNVQPACCIGCGSVTACATSDKLFRNNQTRVDANQIISFTSEAVYHMWYRKLDRRICVKPVVACPACRNAPVERDRRSPGAIACRS
jgi:hypothetical protein